MICGLDYCYLTMNTVAVTNGVLCVCCVAPNVAMPRRCTRTRCVGCVVCKLLLPPIHLHLFLFYLTCCVGVAAVENNLSRRDDVVAQSCDYALTTGDACMLQRR